MQWEFIVALVLAMPVMLLPVALLWYLNIGGIYAAIQEARKKGAAREQGMRAVAEEHREEEELVGTKVTYRKQVATVERRH